MLAIGANLQYGNNSFLAEMLIRKLGFHPVAPVVLKQTTNLRNGAPDPGTTLPRTIGLATKYSASTAPTSNTAADAPTGIGDICLHVKANVSGSSRVPVASIDVYRCTAYTNNTTFTWAQIL